MRDQEMFNILSGLDNVKTKKKQLSESANTDAATQSDLQNTMRGFLELMPSTNLSKRLDETKPEGPKLQQMPGTHTMAKASKDKHPASNFLVGGEEGETPEGEEKLDEGDEDSGWGDELIEALKIIVRDMQPDDMGPAIEDLISQYEAPSSDTEYGDDESTDTMYGEGAIGPDGYDDDGFDSKGRHIDDVEGGEFGDVDDDGFDFGDDMEEAYDPAQGRFVKQPTKQTANPYKSVTEDEIEEDSLGAKQSFADVFRSMEESEEDRSARLEKELFTELDEPELTKNDENGKYNLNDQAK